MLVRKTRSKGPATPLPTAKPGRGSRKLKNQDSNNGPKETLALITEPIGPEKGDCKDVKDRSIQLIRGLLFEQNGNVDEVWDYLKASGFYSGALLHKNPSSIGLSDADFQLLQISYVLMAFAFISADHRASDLPSRGKEGTQQMLEALQSLLKVWEESEWAKNTKEGVKLTVELKTQLFLYQLRNDGKLPSTIEFFKPADFEVDSPLGVLDHRQQEEVKYLSRRQKKIDDMILKQTPLGPGFLLKDIIEPVRVYLARKSQLAGKQYFKELKYVPLPELSESEESPAEEVEEDSETFEDAPEIISSQQNSQDTPEDDSEDEEYNTDNLVIGEAAKLGGVLAAAEVGLSSKLATEEVERVVKQGKPADVKRRSLLDHQPGAKRLKWDSQDSPPKTKKNVQKYPLGTSESWSDAEEEEEEDEKAKKKRSAMKGKKKILALDEEEEQDEDETMDNVHVVFNHEDAYVAGDDYSPQPEQEQENHQQVSTPQSTPTRKASGTTFVPNASPQNIRNLDIRIKSIEARITELIRRKATVAPGSNISQEISKQIFDLSKTKNDLMVARVATNSSLPHRDAGEDARDGDYGRERTFRNPIDVAAIETRDAQRRAGAPLSNSPINGFARARKRWTEEEVEALEAGMLQHGTKWAVIQKEYGGPEGILKDRTQVDLKDKARNEKDRRMKINPATVGVFALAGKKTPYVPPTRD
ncbi:hypothetical protein HDV05_002547 [Chytridiales sp. JEL 0842]|nr:hypothetical protein HDV05_002547 [Chytridiales sp. JEL 0842]